MPFNGQGCFGKLKSLMKLQLIEKKQAAPDIISFYFRPDSPLIYKPGQFLRYRIPEAVPDERGENRFFSIASAPYEGPIQLTTRFAPDKGSTFKKDLKNLEIGQSVEATGPSGSFSMDDPNHNYVFIAGGIGITPFRAILLDLDHQGKPLNVSLFYANRTKEALFKEDLGKLAQKHPEFKIYYVISDEPVTETPASENIKIISGKIDNNLIKSLILNLQSSIFYISGPEPMVLSMEKMIWDMGVPKENTKRDYFPGYEHY